MRLRHGEEKREGCCTRPQKHAGIQNQQPGLRDVGEEPETADFAYQRDQKRPDGGLPVVQVPEPCRYSQTGGGGKR